jgi:hypothetical protein
MKIIKILVVIGVFILGYALGNFLSFSGFGNNNGGAGILGAAKLEVTILDENNKPVANLEVDVAEKPGPPQRGGSAMTDKNGVSTFNIQPGNYFVYFNSGNFPQNLKEGSPQPVQVSEGSTSKVTVILKSK